jgi:3-isopropylmalate dehydrogenase
MGGFQYKGTPQEVSTQVHLTTRFGAERCIRYAFDLTRKRDRMKQLHLVAKTNVLTFVHDTWWRAFNEVGEADYPDIRREYAHVDATCMWFVKNPEWFDVIVVENMFGDIITDLGAMIQGGMGIAAGGNINPEGVSMFEPIGGSAPKYTGQNVICPLAAIGAVQMLLEHVGEAGAATRVEEAIVKGLTGGKIKSISAGQMGMSTSEVGDLVASLV